MKISLDRLIFEHYKLKTFAVTAMKKFVEVYDMYKKELGAKCPEILAVLHPIFHQDHGGMEIRIKNLTT